MSYSRSPVYNYQPCSQSHKMSIGMVSDLVDKPRKDAEVSIKRAERGASCREHVEQNVKRDFRSFSTINERAENILDGCAMITLGQLTANPLLKGNDFFDKQASTSSMICVYEKQTRDSFHLCSSQAILQPVIGEKIENAGAVSQKEGKKDVAAERYEEFPHGDEQDVCMLVKDMLPEQPDVMENRSKETLRMKLQEILGTFPSTSKKYDDSRMGEVVASEMMQVQTDKGDAPFKHRQNSDPIETDSEKADEIIWRPVIRSFAKKRAPAKTRRMNLKKKSLSRNKEEHQGSHAFSFGERSVPTKSCEQTFRCSWPEKHTHVKQSCGIKPLDVIHHVADVVNTQQVITGDKKLQPGKGLSVEGRIMSLQRGCLHENLEPEATILNKNSDSSPDIREKDQPQDADYPTLPEASDHHKSLCSQSPVHHDDYLNSPLFNMTKAVLSSPMSHHFCGFVQTEGGKAACQFKNSPATKDNTGSSDDAATSEEMYANTSEPLTADNAKNGLFSPKRREFDSSEGVFSAKKVYPEDVHTSLETGVIGKPMPFQTKQHCSDGVDHSNYSPTIQSPKASADTDDQLMEPLEESPEDEIARVVSLLGLALERVKSKMMSVTNKRCSDLLTSAAEEIHLQLCNVESQIRADVEMLTSLNKWKRKHLETRLQEQHEHLNFVYEKFKKEIHQHIQDCRGAVEMLEAQHVELKGALERQKISHRKLLLQAQAAVETQLDDVRRQIASVHKLGRQKMLKLKVTIAECLRDGISG